MKGKITTVKFLALAMTGLLATSACSLFGDDEPDFPSPASCSAADYNQYVYDVMKRFYYWYNEVDPDNQLDPTDTTSYPTPQSLINALKYTPLDRFSGVSNATSFNQFFSEGEFIGIGLRLLTDEITGNLMIAYANAGAPADLAGITRGDRIVTINGYSANGLSGTDWEAAWGPSETGVDVELVIEKPDTSQQILTVTKALVTINTTQDSGIINNASDKIGYLHFTNFLSSKSVNELNQQFENFQANGVNELIVDLRYNGGGAVQTARHLGSLIGGDKTADSIFTRLIFNHKSNGYDGYKETFNFGTLANQLNLNRVFFITTDASCSASELLINSLVPDNGIEVIIVGSKTCGKPVGSKVDTECGKALTVINFEIRNAENQGQYFDGISAGYPGLSAFCDATDDLSAGLGNSSENSIATAIDYMNNGQCSALKTLPGMKLKTAGATGRYTLLEGMY